MFECKLLTEKKKEPEPEYGTKYEHNRSWGEQIYDVNSPKLVKVNFESGEVEIQDFEGKWWIT